jgi:hypothetical protein
MQGVRDWTFTTSYCGTVRRCGVGVDIDAADDVEVVATTERIDFEELKRPDPILWSDTVTLFEDELGDNGVAQFTVKTVCDASCSRRCAPRRARSLFTAVRRLCSVSCRAASICSRGSSFASTASLYGCGRRGCGEGCGVRTYCVSAPLARRRFCILERYAPPHRALLSHRAPRSRHRLC